MRSWCVIATSLAVPIMLVETTMGRDYFVLPSYPPLLRKLRTQGGIDVGLIVHNGKVVDARILRHTLGSPTADHVPWEEALGSSVQAFLSVFRLWMFDSDVSGMFEVKVILRLAGDNTQSLDPDHNFRVQVGGSGMPEVIVVEVAPLLIPSG